MDMDIAASDIVKSIAGRDKGKLFFVLQDAGDGFLLLADGRERRVERPKRKKRKHVQAAVAVPAARVAEKIRRGETVSNRELRETLAQLRGAGNPDQEG